MNIHNKKPYISHDKTKQLAQNLEEALQKIRNLEWLNEKEIKAHKATIKQLEQHKEEGHKLLMIAVIFGLVLGFLANGLPQ